MVEGASSGVRRASSHQGMQDEILRKDPRRKSNTTKEESRSGIPRPSHSAILPLPEDVVAQIKSSTTITSLSSVIVDLLKNSFDADATRVEVTVDFQRGGAVLEDNGSGIPPGEFREDGHLGKMYCTSRRQSIDTAFGRNGTFLASLGALSLLTITSHHRLYRSSNTITFHQSKVLTRLLPSSPQHELNFREHGTRVTVRDLFGNMPVRVKQRALLSEDKSESDRLWDGLKQEIVGLLVSWGKPVLVKVRDVEKSKAITFNGQNAFGFTSPMEDDTSAKRRLSVDLRLLQTLLTQASLISPDDWSSWVPVAASTASISIRGSISLTPAPTKRVQFISLGFRPLSRDFGHNELYDELNRLFNLSSFGTVDDDSEVDEAEMERRKKDRRYKVDGYTNKQLRTGGKGIDRWPMFYLRITLKENGTGSMPPDSLLANNSQLKAIIQVLEAMITKWLSAHHFRPRKRRSRKPEARIQSRATSTVSDEGVESPAEGLRAFFRSESAASAQQGSTSTKNAMPTGSTRKRKRSGHATSPTLTRSASNGAVLPFNEWSRIKSARPEFYESVRTVSKLARAPENAIEDNALGQQAGTSTGSSLFVTEPVLPGSLGSRVPSYNKVALMESPSAGNRLEKLVPDTEPLAGLVDESTNDTINWIHPVTKETFLVNARTGCVLPHVPVLTASDSILSARSSKTLTDFNKSLRLVRKEKPGTAEPQKREWLDAFLSNWANPVFPLPEPSVPQASLDGPNTEIAELLRVGRRNHCHINIEKVFKEALITGAANKLSREALKSSEIISQVDKKFILIKMGITADGSTFEDPERQQLVLLDQHAADERFRIESLLAELCTSVPDTEAAFTSELGHKSSIKYTILKKPILFQVSPEETRLFHTHAAHFAAWGILYDLSTTSTERPTRSSSTSKQETLHVRTLPPGISERCKLDPKLLISLLRAELWKRADEPVRSTAPAPTDGTTTGTAHDSQHAWLRALGSCPQGVLDMLNSRACRSAVMFNDELSRAQCEALVRRLAGCAFPFQCAHGRPSMVPLVKLGSGVGGGIFGFSAGEGEEVGSAGGGKGFADTWRAWRAKEER